jgi:hypothetical protein
MRRRWPWLRFTASNAMASPAVRRMLELLDWDDDPQIELREDELLSAPTGFTARLWG